jgi:hypothetical protein
MESKIAGIIALGSKAFIRKRVSSGPAKEILYVLTLLAVSVISATPAAAQAPPTVIDLFAQLSNQSANDGNFATGTVFRVGGVVTSPTVSGSFPAYGFMSQTLSGITTNESLFFRSDDSLPNTIFQSVPASTGLTGSWTLHVSSTPTFAAGTATTFTTPAVGSVAVMPFVQSMTITANSTGPSPGLSPSISWTLPTGGPTIDSASITISDNTAPITVTNVNPFTNAGAAVPYLGTFQQANIIYTAPAIPGSTTNFTVPTTNNNPNNANQGAPVLQYGHTYSVGIILDNTRPGSTPVPGCPPCTVDSRSVSYFDYTPINPTSIGLPAGTVINLPSTTPVSTTSGLFAGPVYSFNVASVGSSSVTYIDPVLATGYVYNIGATDPNFRSVNAVTPVGNGIYSLLAWNGMSFVPEGTIQAGIPFDFTTHGFVNGVTEFEITGLNPGVNPTDIAAFVTGLTFMSDGSFTGTMQAINTINTAVPEPSTWAMMLIGFAGLGFAFHQSRRKVSMA